jgi:hypothetical protein
VLFSYGNIIAVIVAHGYFAVSDIFIYSRGIYKNMPFYENILSVFKNTIESMYFREAGGSRKQWLAPCILRRARAGAASTSWLAV